MIRVNDASFSYRPGAPVFAGLNFGIPGGQMLAVLGANGIGKTTLFRCILGFLRLNSGTIMIDGSDARAMKSRDFWARVSYVPQAKPLVFDYPVLTMVVMGCSGHIGFGRNPTKADYDEAHALLDELGLSPLADRSCSSLSGGELQLVLIARALAKRPKILVMDEPESNLDLKNQLKTLELITALSREKKYTVVINTHFPAHALRCADKTLLLGGVNFLFGDTVEVVTAENIEAYFGVRARIIDFEDRQRQFTGIIPFELIENNGGSI
jgi:iron complex transport system ATP-binding protein